MYLLIQKYIHKHSQNISFSREKLKTSEAQNVPVYAIIMLYHYLSLNLFKNYIFCDTWWNLPWFLDQFLGKNFLLNFTVKTIMTIALSGCYVQLTLCFVRNMLIFQYYIISHAYIFWPPHLHWNIWERFRTYIESNTVIISFCTKNSKSS